LLASLCTKYAPRSQRYRTPRPRPRGSPRAARWWSPRRNDGRLGPSPWVPNPDRGHWQPLLNPDGTQMLDPTPCVGGVRPFLMRSSSQFRTDGS